MLKSTARKVTSFQKRGGEDSPNRGGEDIHNTTGSTFGGNQGNLAGSQGASAGLGGAQEALLALERRCAEAEGERDQVLFNMTQSQAESKAEIEFLQKEIETGNQKRNQMQARVDRTEKIENAIIALYLDMKDRTHELHKDAAAKAKALAEEREGLKQMNPIAVLDALRANLRNLLAFKEDYENELKDRLSRRKTDLEVQVEDLQARVGKMSAYNDSAKSNTEAAVKKMQAAEQARVRILKDTEEALAASRRNIDELMQVVKSKEEEVLALKAQIAAKDQDLRHKDIKIMRISALESQIQANKLQHQNDLQKLQAQHVKSLAIFEREIGQFTKTEAENRLYLEMVQRANEEVAGYRRNIMLVQHNEEEARAEKLDKVVAEKDRRIKDLEGKLREGKAEYGLLSEQYRDQKREFVKLFDTISKRVKKSKDEKSKSQADFDIHNEAERNPHYVSLYKARLKGKEREVQDLNDKVRRLLTVEHRNKVVRKSFEVERARYEAEINALKRGDRVSASGAVLPRRPATAGGASGAAGEPELGELRKENENLKETAKAYDALKQTTVSAVSAYDSALGASTFSSGGLNSTRPAPPSAPRPSTTGAGARGAGAGRFVS